MANTIKLKTGSGSDPSASDLIVGEIAIRTDSGKLFTKKDNGTVAEISGSGGGIEDGDKGDITVSNGGDTFTIDSGVVTSAKIADGTIVNADVNASAAIDVSKLSGVLPLAGGTMTGMLVVADTIPRIRLQDTNNNPDYELNDTNGVFNIRDNSNATNRFSIGTDGTVDITGNLDVGAGIDVTGNVIASGNITANNGTVTVSGSAPKITFTETNDNPDYKLEANGGNLAIVDTTNSATRFSVNASGASVTGNISVSGTVDGVDIAARNTLFGGLTSSSGVLTNGVTATTQGSSDNTTKVATTAYVTTAISNLINNAPSALDTLKELSDALGADANFSTTVTNSLATKLPLAGGTLTGNVIHNDNVKAIFGTSSDLEIYHSGSHSIINNNTGDLRIESNRLELLNHDSNEFYLTADDNGSVVLYCDGTQRLTTSSSGISVSGAIAVSGTVDNRDIATDGAKLDTIESNATADQTASEILTLIKTVDGAGSGLDADTLDGVSSASFLRSDANDTSSGTIAFGTGNLDPDSFSSHSGGFGNIADGSGWTARGLFVHGGGTGDAAAIAHNGSKLYFGIQNNSSANSMATWLDVTPSSRIINFQTADNANNVRIGGNKIFHAGNDGSGSGLNADLLDGVEGSNYLRSDQADTMSGNFSLEGNLLLTGSATTTNQDRTISFTGFDKENTNDFTDNAFIRHTTNTGGHSGSVLNIASKNDSNDGIAFETHASSQLKHNGYTIWDANNDGSGSGLDSDLLDGQEGSYYRNASNLNAGTIPAARLSASDLLTKIKTVDGSGSGLDADTLDGISSASFVRSDANDGISGFLTITNDNGIKILTSTNAAGAKIQFSDHVNGSYAQNGTLSYKHADGQVTTTGGSSNDGWVFEGSETRTVVKVVGDIEATSNIYGAGSNITALNASNLGSGTVPQARLSASTLLTLIKTVDGAGSGLNADQLDGISSASFVRGDGTDNGATTIKVNDADFIVQDSTDSVTNFIWRDHSGNKLYLGTAANAVVTPRSNVVPNADSTYNLGANGTRWANIYGDQLYGAGGNITGLNASNISSGTISAARVPTLNQNTTGTSGGFTAGNASNLNSGTIPAARLPNHSASLLTSGTIPDGRISDIGNSQAAIITFDNLEKSNFSSDGQLGFDSSQGLLLYRTQQGTTGTVTVLDGANVDAGTGISITNTGTGGTATESFTFSLANHSADLLTSGTVADARISTLTASKLTGALPAIDGSNLTGIAAGATGGGSDQVFYENDQTVTTSYTITNGKNAMAAGPITIQSGAVLTVGSGENLTIV